MTFLFSLLTHGSFFLSEYSRDWDFDLPEGIIVLSIWIGSVKYLTERRYVFRMVISLMIVFSVYFLTFYDTNPVLVFLLSSVMILEIVSLETMPVNVVFFVLFPVLHFTAYRVLLLDRYIPAVGMVSYILGLILWGGGGLLLIHYRERLIRSNQKVEQANSAILKFNQANREYQEYLVKVEAEAMNAERNRITRDIHDIVGYTLTNNIVLMETATDIVQTNPLELTKLLKTARENAQDGQERIREILYRYRQESYEIATSPRLIPRKVHAKMRPSDARTEPGSPIIP
jgi:signal transduction histidine kinase